MRTMHVDGSSVDSGLLRPLVSDRDGLLRVLLVPIIVVVGAVFALASFRWVLTGFGRGVESLTTSGQARDARAAPRQRRPVPASATGPSGAGPPMTETQRAVQRVQQRSLLPGERGPRPQQPPPGRQPPPRGRRRR